MNTAKTLRTSIFALVTATALAACSSSKGPGDGGGGEPQPGDAYLTIVGDTNVFLEHDWRQTLTVKYHDSEGQALAGLVEFTIVGTPGGATLADDASATGPQGLANAELIAGAEGDAVFRVRAEAEYADAVEWTVSVSEGEPPLPPLDVTGRYNVQSDFDLVSGVPGTVGDVVNGFVDMTDGPYDPATWLIDLVVEEIDSGTIENLINAARPVLDGVVNDLLLSLAPQFVNDILEIGDKFGQVARNFGTMTTLDVEDVGGVEGDELAATHTMTGVFFKIDGQQYSFAMADFGMNIITIENIPFSVANETDVAIGAHEFPLSYGSLLLLALDNVIIPMIDPWANNLYDLLGNMVDCYAVGVEIADFIGFGSVGLYEGACELGIGAAAGFLYDQIESLDASAMVLGIAGEARAQDTNTDRKVDVLSAGEWNGNITYAGQPGTLSGATFRGQRMVLP
jgi:hypothetical protein